MRISDWSPDVCSSDLRPAAPLPRADPDRRRPARARRHRPYRSRRRPRSLAPRRQPPAWQRPARRLRAGAKGLTKMFTGIVTDIRSEEHTSELQSLMRISYAVFCLKKKKTQRQMTEKSQK